MRLIDRDWHAEIEDEVLEAIYVDARHAFPREGGGFLFGYYSSDVKTVHVQHAERAKRFRSTGTSFERDVDKEVFERLYKEKGWIYVGEWHSHPNGSSLYSGKELKVMEEIEAFPSTGITNPLLLIVSLSKKEIKGFDLYMYEYKRLLQYESY